MRLYQINAYETQVMAQEIFWENGYLRDGIVLPSDPVVVDVGANIGIFSLFIKEMRPSAVIHAIEPSPEVFRVLKKNLEGYDHCTAYNYGLGAETGTSRFVYFPGNSILSGFAESDCEDVELLKIGLPKLLTPDMKNDLLSKLLAKKVVFTCPKTTLSDFFARHLPSRVDLLKIDTEGAELDILAGIQSSDWKSIAQITMEVHRRADLLQLVKLLEANNFAVKVSPVSSMLMPALFRVSARNLQMSSSNGESLQEKCAG